MDLKTYLHRMSLDERTGFATRCRSSRGHLQNICYGKKCAAELAMAIERESGGQVTRKDLRPNDYWLIWPDLSPPKRESSTGSRLKEARA